MSDVKEPIANRPNNKTRRIFITMSSRYKVYDHQIPVFVTSTVVGWIDALSREWYKELLCESLQFCIDNKGLKLHAWVLMNNHFHLIVSASAGHKIGDIMRDLKKFTAKRIIDAIAQNPEESRKEWMINMFAFAGAHKADNEQYQFWQHDYHPITLDTGEKLRDRFAYLHNNPVKAGIVWDPEHYKYSSAIDYFTERPGLLPIVKLVL